MEPEKKFKSNRNIPTLMTPCFMLDTDIEASLTMNDCELSTEIY